MDQADMSTVHRLQCEARSARRSSYVTGFACLWSGAFLVLIEGFWLVHLIWVLVLMSNVHLFGLQRARSVQLRQQAWEIETTQVLSGMFESGLAEMQDLPRILAEGPPPPLLEPSWIGRAGQRVRALRQRKG